MGAGFRVFGLGVVTAAFLVITVAGLAVTRPHSPYQVKLHTRGETCSKNAQQLEADVLHACLRVHRACHAIVHYWKEIGEMYLHGTNMAVLKRNREFYRKRLTKRVNECLGGKLYFKCVGRCGTSRETLAFVRTPFGFVLSTIHLCDEFFSGTDRAAIIAHEFGRLEGIGDSPDFDTDNIFVWDRIVDNLSNDVNYQQLEKRHAANNR